MTVTAEEIEAAKTPAGAWRKATLAAWGVAWPPEKGWKAALIAGQQPPARKDATDLHEIQRQLVSRIGERPVGSASRFALMDAADRISLAIAAEEREDIAQARKDAA